MNMEIESRGREGVSARDLLPLILLLRLIN